MSLLRLHLDWETRSTVDIRNTGMHVYCEHPTTSIWLCRYRFEGDTTVGEWRRGQPFPQRLIDHVAAGGVIVAHNAGFERTVWNVVLPRQLGYAVPLMTIEQQDCTMARAYAMGLPGALEIVAKIVDAPVQKDMTGSANMKRMAKPRKINPDGSVIWWDEPDRIQQLSDYCKDDVLAEEGVDNVLPALSKDDRETWVMDQRMNERGIHLDVNFAAKAWDVVEVERGRLDKKMNALTGGVVTACSRRQALVDWLNARGHNVTSLAKGAIEDVQAAIAVRADALAKRAVELYVQANRTSTSKLKKVQETVCADGRSRGTVQCHGAFTGRWSGRLWQPQNLKRLGDDDGPIIRLATIIILQYDAETACNILEAAFGDVIEVISLCMRSVVCAEEGHELIGADYSNIEGRLIAWLAGATLKLEAFAAQDRKEGYDLYNLSYANSFGIDVTTMPKKSFMRQIGKVQELALGYQGSIGAYINMAANYGIKPEEIAELVLKNCTQDDYDKAAWAYKQPGANHFDLDREVWIGLKIVVNLWRASPLNADVAQFWWDLQDAALEAVTNPGRVVHVGKTGRIAYVVSNGFMWCQLPTGKCLAYCNPRVRTKTTTRVREDGSEYEQVSRSVEYDGWDGEKKKWGTIHLYGGLQANHVTQGTAAEIMKRGMKNLEAGKCLWGGTLASNLRQRVGALRCFQNILTVHDEAMAEVKECENDEQRAELICIFETLMLDVGPEFNGLPLAASGWMDKRYVK